MASILNKILSDLYTDKITIKEACTLLNKTREEVWELLDSFEYFPTSEDVLIACRIEKQSMRTIENTTLIDTKLMLISPLELFPYTFSPYTQPLIREYPQNKTFKPSFLPHFEVYRAEEPNSITLYEKYELKHVIEVEYGA